MNNDVLNLRLEEKMNFSRIRVIRVKSFLLLKAPLLLAFGPPCNSHHIN